MSDCERNRLLSVLEAHGKSFLDSFTPLEANAITGKRKSRGDDGVSRKRWKRDEEEEWHGINHDSECEDSDDSFEHTDDEFSSTRNQSNVTIFSDTKPRKSVVIDHVAKAQMKAFMSSKISKMSSSITTPTTKRSREEEENEKTNVQNDALLHKLVHTKLLSGSMNTELDLNPAQRRKALAGRVLELSGEAKLGKGEKAVRAIERTKAAKRVREGLNNKQQERRKQELEEAKNLGNYHPTLKKLFEASSSGPTRKREKGMKMGVGTFNKGSLRLRREDVNAVMGGGFSREGGNSKRDRPHKRK